ncbi:hypothetical protein GSI_05672 [Ganoderma sinense ZZ0214-1]|uniref:Uncharacterized protein n=1 Tax=Ganoderma sinense ZZ0214-1 TaxID=1077348 RepID=A0A2G8SB40_9APHY|nr:hypothetical protein GSI_05672 [Ganoderma sinense ZZ0214-1]
MEMLYGGFWRERGDTKLGGRSSRGGWDIVEIKERDERVGCRGERARRDRLCTAIWGTGLDGERVSERGIGEEGFVAKTLGATLSEKSSILGGRGRSLEEVVRGRCGRVLVWFGKRWRRGTGIGMGGRSGGVGMLEGIASLFERRGSEVEAVGEEGVEGRL